MGKPVIDAEDVVISRKKKLVPGRNAKILCDYHLLLQLVAFGIALLESALKYHQEFTAIALTILTALSSVAHIMRGKN